MKTIFYLSILFVTVTMMSSCENELPFNINNNPPKLVMNALINAESTDNLLFLNFTSKENSTHVQNVTVEVRINGELKESLRPLPPETEGNPQCRFGITSRFTPGDAVRIDAITDDGQYHAWTEINVPQRPFEIEMSILSPFRLHKADIPQNICAIGLRSTTVPMKQTIIVS